MTDELYNRTENKIRYWTREELLIRTETAEAEVAALRARVAELEDAARWRPVSEPPKKDGDYLVFRRPDLKYQSDARPDAVMMDVAWFKAGRTRHTGELCEWFNNPIILPITHWRPLPAPPQEAPAA